MMRIRSATIWKCLTVATHMAATTRAFSAVPKTSSSVATAENLLAVTGLEPASLWKHFGALSSIPRPSKKEEAVLNYIKNFCQERGDLEWTQDAVGNLAVFRQGQGAGTTAPPVIIQGHVDMVTEKNAETVFDFNTDPIRLQTYSKSNGERWMSATDTTLGADNGIGVAAALALLEETDLDMPPLQALFTIDEETGLTGATELDAVALGLTGKTMLNLDTEEWGELYVGCAGGGESELHLDLARDSSSSSSTKTTTATKLVKLKVEGLMGGHSGINIHEGRANAILLCASATQTVLRSCPSGVRLVSFTGGDKHNAIPREASAVLQIDDNSIIEQVQSVVATCAQAARAEYGMLETNLKMNVVDVDTVVAESPLEKDSARRLLSLLLGLPHGPLKFSHAMPDLVETSNNVASLHMNEQEATILCSTRSSVSPALEAARDKLSAVASLAGARIERWPAYPGWNPNLQSPLLQRAQAMLERQTGRAPGVKAIHAGLECGLLIEKLGGTVDALSFGPTIQGAHSPDECIHVDTVPPFYELVLNLLNELAHERHQS